MPRIAVFIAVLPNTRIMDVKTTVLLAVIIRSEFVHGEEDTNGIFDTEFSLVVMLIIVVFSLAGVYICVYFTCCHEYLCTVSDDVGCCSDGRGKEIKPDSMDDGNVQIDNSQRATV